MEFTFPELSVTLLIIILTTVVSIGGFSNQKVINDLIFYPPAISQKKQWYRFFTCGLIHADVFHLIFNMYALYTFGDAIESIFERLFGEIGMLLYIGLYVSALLVSLLPTYLKNKDNYHYRSLGASGAVAAVVFATIMFIPMGEIGLFFVPGLGFPAFIFGIIYLAVTAYLDRRGGGGINHSAHFWGSVYGIVFVILACYLLSDYPVVQKFIEQVTEWVSRF